MTPRGTPAPFGYLTTCSRVVALTVLARRRRSAYVTCCSLFRVDAEALAHLTEGDLGPLLAATATHAPPTKTRRKRGGREAPGNRMWVSVPGGVEVTLTRSLPLSVDEAALLEPYGNAIGDLEGLPPAVARTAADDVLLRAIAGQVGGQYSTTVEEALRFLFNCAVTTYEGQAVNLSVLIEFDAEADEPRIPNLEAYRQRDWHAVLGSGVETGVVIDKNGAVLRIEDASKDGEWGEDEAFRPEVLQHVCDWTIHTHRVAVTLTRNREILLFKNGRLIYIHRGGGWRGIPANVVYRTGWGVKISRDVKRAVVASLIDSSLAHHGACVAIIGKGYKESLTAEKVLRATDHWPDNERAGLYSSGAFQDLSRRQRIELLSMDGATVMDYTGTILTAGAIVAVPGGSSGGGRLAATKSLAKFGAAFKVSQDGPIQLYGVGDGEEPTLRLTFA